MENLVADDTDVFLSVITPCYNEELTVDECASRVRKVLQPLGIKYEHIFIDNCSVDATLEKLSEIKSKDKNVRVLANSENVGAFRSMQKGIEVALGDFVVPFLAADSQDPPEIIAKMLELQRVTDCDTVIGLRSNRKENHLLRFFRIIFYRTLHSNFSGTYKSGASEFRLMRNRSAMKLLTIRDETPFLRIYMARIEGRAEYLKYEMKERTAGSSSASFFSLVDDALNGLSLSMPSMFSRALVFFIPLSILALLTAGIGLIGAFFDSFWAFRIAVVGLLTSLVFFGLSIQAWMGHYVFMIHAQLRRPPEVTTTEIS